MLVLDIQFLFKLFKDLREVLLLFPVFCGIRILIALKIFSMN